MKQIDRSVLESKVGPHVADWLINLAAKVDELDDYATDEIGSLQEQINDLPSFSDLSAVEEQINDLRSEIEE